MLTLACRMANQLFFGFTFPCSVSVTRAAVAPFRLWPIDIDLFGHMNNASYIRVAELSRWCVSNLSFPPLFRSLHNFICMDNRRMLAESGLLVHMMRKQIVFLAVEQTITYSRPILPFQKYAVTTTVTVSEDDKWMYYHHSFDQHPDHEGGKKPKHYALIHLKAVMKENTGKTVKPSQICALNKYHRDLLGPSSDL